jgi:hypothetical protein
MEFRVIPSTCSIRSFRSFQYHFLAFARRSRLACSFFSSSSIDKADATVYTIWCFVSSGSNLHFR